MERNALAYLADWKLRQQRKPLVIRSARQVGKTELVRIFAREHFDSLIEINFDERPSQKSLFESGDISKILRYIEIDSNQRIVPGKALLFLDEVQAAPSVLATLRYFYEKLPSLHVVCAGSLLDFALAEPEYSTPVGRVEFLFLGPMRFDEFLLARVEHEVRQYLAAYRWGEAVPQSLHDKLMGHLREYLLIGGLPGVVKAYIEAGLDASAASRELEALRQTYYLDFPKYKLDFPKYKRRVDVPLLQGLFRAIPLHIGATLKYSSLYSQARSREIRALLDLLEKARLIYPVFHSDGNGIPLQAQADRRFFKLLFLDVGLLGSLLGLTIGDLLTRNDLTTICSGAVAEQFVGQHLLYSGTPNIEPSLHYWNRPNKGSTAEVDYLVASGDRIVPVEVKAGATGRLRSLHVFVQEKASPIALRFSSALPSVLETASAVARKPARPFWLLSLPLYMATEASRLLLR